MLIDGFSEYRIALTGQRLSTIWRGYGSASSWNSGKLTPMHRKDGTPPNHPRGGYSIMIEGSWRIEDENTILCGSWSQEEHWEGVFDSLLGRTVEDASLFVRLPEPSVALSGQRYVASFTTAEGQPE